MSETTPVIPVVDIQTLVTASTTEHGSSGLDLGSEEVNAVSQDICRAFQTAGFVYLKNHGIPDELLNSVRKISAEFFKLPTETKKNYQRQGNDNHGYVGVEVESLNPDRPGDLKEAYNVTPLTAKVWPDDVVPGFQDTVLSFYKKSEQLAMKILDAMALGLGLQDVQYFSSRHSHWPAMQGSLTTLRVLHYPPLGDKNVKAGQVRCGEHSDYGSITLLFQDDVGGLEAQTTEGVYQAAPPIPGTILVNIGDLMQRWTSDKLRSTKHRVLIPEEEMKRNTSRMSIALFVHPSEDCLISCIDGSDKYEPITSLDYINMRFGVTY